MGLDVSHSCWHGAYSAFMRWRVKIARAADVPIWLMASYWDGMPYGETIHGLVEKRAAPSPFVAEPGRGFVATRESLRASLDVALRMDADTAAMQGVLETILPWLPLSWEQLRPDPIHILLNHSDCDGEIAAADCGPLADRLAELLPLLPEGGGGGHIQNWRGKTQQFIDGLREAASRNETVTFS